MEDLLRMVKDLKRMTVTERRDQVGIEPKRADVLLAGAMIMWRTMETLNFQACNISSRGLRYGVLMDLRYCDLRFYLSTYNNQDTYCLRVSFPLKQNCRK